MRWDWIPLSAAALVVGAVALAFAALLNPVPTGGDAAETVATVSMAGGRWLLMGVMYFLASVALTLGLPAVLSPFAVRARALGVLAVAVLAIGFVGTSGYAMLLVFFRALVREDAIRTGSLDSVTSDVGLGIFLWGWVGAFYGGVLLLALALLVARRTPVWVPLLLVVFVALLPLGGTSRAVPVVQTLLMAIAFVRLASVAVNGASRRVAASAAARTDSAPAF